MKKFQLVIALAVVALVAAFAAAPAYATRGADHNTAEVCHPKSGGWVLISPDHASSHIDETTGAPKHEHDGRVDVYAVDGACPALTPEPSPSETPTEPEPSPSSTPSETPTEPEPSPSETPTEPEPSPSSTPSEPEPSPSSTPSEPEPSPSSTPTRTTGTPTRNPGTPVPTTPAPSRTTGTPTGNPGTPLPSDEPAPSRTTHVPSTNPGTPLPLDDATPVASSTPDELAQTGADDVLLLAAVGAVLVGLGIAVLVIRATRRPRGEFR